MFKQIDQTFEQMLKKCAENGCLIAKIRKAYAIAKKLHYNQKRKDGTPYLSHPVEVAKILANLNFDDDVICAALLHDVIEDCGYTLEEVAKEFNHNVSQMVDCVSAIDKAKYIFDKDNIYENQNFEKASIEQQSFEKLVAIGRENPLGFCIKFADRLHNLSTIATFEYSKQLEKVKETEKWIIPIAKILNAEYFFRELKNECFKVIHKYHCEDYLWRYSNYFASNKHNVEKLLTNLKELFADSYIKHIEINPSKEYKIYEDLLKKQKNITINKISQGQMLKVATYNIYLLHDQPTSEEALNLVVTQLLSRMTSSLKISDAKIGSFTQKPYFVLEDNFKNKYKLYVMSINDYKTLQVGTLNGMVKDLIDDQSMDDLIDDLIKVKTRSGEIKYMPRGSTVLDFAFKIHNDIGFGFKYAIVNNSKTKCPPYTKIYDGDQIEIIVDKNDYNEIINNADIKWLAYVNSPLAKKMLIRYFEKLLNFN